MLSPVGGLPEEWPKRVIDKMHKTGEPLPSGRTLSAEKLAWRQKITTIIFP